ncbi:hypothetical protein B0H14DRAFT_2566225 [Mycena olivaceomarginata]|nr:hypothetical protein B0H14DRAFT_2566225 [Mycena olivaceomarginata]
MFDNGLNTFVPHVPIARTVLQTRLWSSPHPAAFLHTISIDGSFKCRYGYLDDLAHPSLSIHGKIGRKLPRQNFVLARPSSALRDVSARFTPRGNAKCIGEQRRGRRHRMRGRDVHLSATLMPYVWWRVGRMSSSEAWLHTVDGGASELLEDEEAAIVGSDKNETVRFRPKLRGFHPRRSAAVWMQEGQCHGHRTKPTWRSIPS